MDFESVLEAQRNEFNHLNSVDESSFPKLVSELGIERHATSIYTNNISLMLYIMWMTLVVGVVARIL